MTKPAIFLFLRNRQNCFTKNYRISVNKSAWVATISFWEVAMLIEKNQLDL
jgi:PIN domain nuclease of toxin-antitoxin system